VCGRGGARQSAYRVRSASNPAVRAASRSTSGGVATGRSARPRCRRAWTPSTPRVRDPGRTRLRGVLQVSARDIKNVPGRKTDSTMLRGFSSSRRVPACLLPEKGQQRDGSVSNLTARPYIPRVYLYFAIVTAQFPWHPSCLYARSGQAHGSAGRVSTTPGATRGPQPYEAWR
jgi:hypothetical protein